MSTLVGLATTQTFTLLDSEGAAVTGEVFTADQVLDPSLSAFDYTLVEVGSGMYQVTFAVSAVGTYYLRLVTDTATPTQVFEIEAVSGDLSVGDTVSHYFTIRDDDGAYRSGIPVAVEISRDPIGGSFAVTIDDLGEGLYRASYSGAATGDYALRLLADLSSVGDDDQRFVFTDRFFAVAVVAPVLVSSRGPTLDELVRDVALACRDYLDTAATVDSPDETTWVDNLEFAARSPKTFTGASFFVLSAADPANVGKECRVRDFANEGLVLTPPLPSPPVAGDTGYLTNLESTGFTRRTYVNQINARIDSIFPEHLVPASYTFADAFDGAAGTLVPPVDFTHIYDISYGEAGWDLRPVHVPQAEEWMPGWHWDSADGAIVITGGYKLASDGRAYTLRGFGRPPRLLTNDAMTTVAHEWLVEATSATMITSLRDPRRLSEGAMHINRADALRIKTLTQIPPNTIRIR